MTRSISCSAWVCINESTCQDSGVSFFNVSHAARQLPRRVSLRTRRTRDTYSPMRIDEETRARQLIAEAESREAAATGASPCWCTCYPVPRAFRAQHQVLYFAGMLDVLSLSEYSELMFFMYSSLTRSRACKRLASGCLPCCGHDRESAYLRRSSYKRSLSSRADSGPDNVCFAVLRHFPGCGCLNAFHM